MSVRWLEAERRLWRCLQELRGKGAQFRPKVALGARSPSFISVDPKLVVEVDPAAGGQSAEALKHARKWVGRGFDVLRVSEDEVMSDPVPVLKRIQRLVAQP